jgi:predicted aspartyl protease
MAHMRLLRFTLAALLSAASAHAAGAPEPSPEAVIAALPFVPGGEANRVRVDLAPEGARPFVMELDTGASVSVMSPRMARELGVSVRKQKATPYRRATRLGRDLQFWVDTRRSDTAASGSFEYGLVGGEFLDDYVLELDFPGKTVRFLDPKRYAVPESVDAPDERVTRLLRVATRISVPIRVNGHELVVNLDTGAPVPAVLSGAAAREAGIDPAELPTFGRIGLTVGSTGSSLYEEPAFELAGMPLGSVALLVAPKGLFNMGDGNDSLVGYDVLAPLVVRIDYPRKRMWLKRTSPEPIRFQGADYALARETGAFLNTEAAGHYVWAVRPGSPAERIGLRAGDIVVSSERAAAPPLDDVLRRILDRAELQISRREGEIWIDRVLPESEAVAE